MAQKTIGVLFDSLFNAYEAHIWQYLVKVAGDKDLNLICYALRKRESEKKLRITNFCKMINHANLHGLIAFSMIINSFSDQNDLIRFYQSLQPLPIINIGMQLEAYPCVTIDNQTGMQAVIRHLIEEHSRKNIAFIRGLPGNPEAEIRFQVYKDLLAEYKIPLREEFIINGDFLPEAGTAAITTLLDKRKVEFDAVISANDYMALNAMRELQRRGFKIPEDVAVTGFDDILESRCGIQPLTTVRQPVYEIARSAIELLLSFLYNRETSHRILLPATLIIRRSCGCYMHTAAGEPSGCSVAPAAPVSQLKEESELTAMIRDTFTQMKKFLQGRRIEEEMQTWAEILVTSLSHTLENFTNEKSFFLVLENIILNSIETGVDTLQWYPVLSGIFEEYKRKTSLESGKVSLAGLWKQALALVSNIADYRYVYTNIDYREMNIKLHTISEALKNIFDTNKLSQIMTSQLQELGIKRFFLCKYLAVNDSATNVKILIGYDEDGPLRELSKSYPLQQILPEKIKFKYKEIAFILFPLNFQDIDFGYLVFNIEPIEGSVFESITMHLSNSLQGANIFNLAKQQTLELETKATLQSYCLESSRRKLLDEQAQREKTEQLLKAKETEIRQLREKLELKSKLDNLTNLYNREALFDLLKKEINRTKRNLWRIDQEFQPTGKKYHKPSGNLRNHFGFFSIILIDIDNFKEINDQYGPRQGDEILIIFSRILQKEDVFRQEDIPGRFSSKEFIIILPNTNAVNACRAAERLTVEIRRTNFSQGIKITVSIGIAEYSPADEESFSVIHNAEHAIHYAKTHGKNQIILYNDIKDR